MRENVKRAVCAWRARKRWEQKSQSIAAYAPEPNYHDGMIMSYRTPLVLRLPDGRVIFNTTKYSKTTSTQQGDLEWWFSLHGIPVLRVADFPKDGFFLDLIRLADDPKALIKGAARFAGKARR